MSDVFISYKAEDRRRVQPLVQALQADGLSVWWDEHIGAGDSWRETIERQLDEAKCVVVIWSKRSVAPEGRFVREEASRAQRRGVYVPVLIDAIDPPLGFGESQATSLRGWHGDPADPHYQTVLSAVRKNVGGRRRASVRPLPQRRVDRRTAMVGGAAAAVAVAGVGGWALLKPSAASAGGIAVLPFANLSGDPAQAYFSDGVAEEIRSALARIAGLKVVGRTSSEAVRNDDAETAARKLGVSNILSGSVRQSPSTIRVSAELIDGHTGLDKWSQDYDRNPGDAIKIQTDIAENVASALSAALGMAARAAVSVGGTSNVKAQRLYLQVKAMRTGAPAKAAFEQAFQLLDSAISIDPNYADAYALKSGLLVAYGNNYAGAQELPKNRAEALGLAQTALRIAPNLAEAHRALYSVYSSNLQLAPAYSEVMRARQLAPSDPDILAAYAGFTAQELGRGDEGLGLYDEAIAMDPLNAGLRTGRLETLFRGRRYGDAVAYGKQLQASAPQFNRAVTIADSLVALGRLQEAQTYYNQAPTDYWGRLTGEAILRIRGGDRAGAQAKLARLQQIFGDAASTQFGEIYAQLGDRDKAIAALERAYAIKDGGLLGLRVDPWLDPLRSDPRFGALLQKMNFPAS